MSAPTPSTSSLISYPAPSPPPEASTSAPPAAPAPTILKHRLYVGNLHPSVDEYTLVQVFAKYGTIAKLDFLFHKAGPLRGRPRGYAFVEYAHREHAAKALVGAHDRLVRGRKLVVTLANQAPIDSAAAPRAPLHHRRPQTDAGKPTALSLLKAPSRAASTTDKIAALEAKLAQMSAPPLVPHPSLPQRPLGQLPPIEQPSPDDGRPRGMAHALPARPSR